MRVDLFDFTLPEALIALRPAVPRETARLLDVPEAGAFVDRRIADLPALLAPGDALVVNDTRVVPARLRGTRRRAGADIRIEATLHGRVDARRWLAFVRPGRRLRTGDGIVFDARSGLSAEVEAKRESGDVLLLFDRGARELDEAIAEAGEVPLPPYIAAKRAVDARDVADYQTVYARHDGAVAAPTAGLHLSAGMLEALRARGVTLHRLTLHVGAGTFLPVKAETTAEHRMHAEWGRIDEETATALNAVRRRGGKLVAVGTTSLRLLESAASPDGTVRPFEGLTDIFITPGYRFRAVDRLLTNFHLPRSTLFMLVSALAGRERMQAAYAHAVASAYRFYSYGDACLLDRAAGP